MKMSESAFTAVSASMSDRYSERAPGRPAAASHLRRRARGMCSEALGHKAECHSAQLLDADKWALRLPESDSSMTQETIRLTL